LTSAIVVAGSSFVWEQAASINAKAAQITPALALCWIEGVQREKLKTAGKGTTHLNQWETAPTAGWRRTIPILIAPMRCPVDGHAPQPAGRVTTITRAAWMADAHIYLVQGLSPSAPPDIHLPGMTRS
jgi:hypothetical protein